MSTTVGSPKTGTKIRQSLVRSEGPTTPPLDAAPTEGVAPDRLHRLSVEQYNERARPGILTKDDRIERIEVLLKDLDGREVAPQAVSELLAPRPQQAE